MWIQEEVTLEPRPRGFHLVTRELTDAVPALADLRIGIASLFMRHTSASLTLHENASPDVRRDFGAWFDRAVPEGADYWTHTLEGTDDMPAHLKASLTGSELTIPVRDGRLALGTVPRSSPGRSTLVAGDLPLRAPRIGRPAQGAGHGLRRAPVTPSRPYGNMRSCAGAT